MNVVYALETFPSRNVTSSIFLAGPTPRSPEVASWRPKALKILADMGYDGVVFVPEPSDGVWHKDYEGQVTWEDAALHRADVILFWIPRDMVTMPALTTNDEWGFWKSSGKVVLGVPPESVSTKYQKFHAKENDVPVWDTLEDTVRAAVARTEELVIGARRLPKRLGGENAIPLHIWSTPTFQRWFSNQSVAGNRIQDARVEYTLWNKRTPFLWVLWVDMWIASEGRNKDIEVLASRPDICTAVLHGPVHRGDLGGTRVLLVREYRSPANNPTGMVLELPGGSSKNPEDDDLTIIQHEVSEETGVDAPASLFQPIGIRQVMSTLSLHRANCYSLELTDKALDEIVRTSSTPRGVAEDTERSYTVVTTLEKILRSNTMDWSMIGMVLTAVLKDGDVL